MAVVTYLYENVAVAVLAMAYPPPVEAGEKLVSRGVFLERGGEYSELDWLPPTDSFYLTKSLWLAIPRYTQNESKNPGLTDIFPFLCLSLSLAVYV
ncbi:hypothetical protein B0J18DRAFT_426638 [Chaetomium sp. MPI-SDFR-AT-0129]|nr:hypothetical protein B0J18DRAFT_426638 [Chaetomium sp. MPI-SDFR-AT-0129]